MTLFGAALNAELTCTEVALHLGGRLAWIEMLWLLASTVVRSGSSSGRIDAGFKGRYIFNLCFVNAFMARQIGGFFLEWGHSTLFGWLT